MRLSSEMESLVAEEAKRTRRSKGAVVEGLAAEALKARLFPGIAFRGVDWDRRAWVTGSSLDVWQIVDAYRDFRSVERMVVETDISDRSLRLALAYYERFPEEIDELVERNRMTIDELRDRFPTVAASAVSAD
jgi:hypothetical protein